jgi:uncharacterized protein
MVRLPALVVAAAALGAATAAQAQSDVPLVNAVPSMTVLGEAKRDVAPDVALVRVGVVTDRATAAQAAQDNAQAASVVVAAARAAGVESQDIQTTDLGLAAVADQKDASKIRTYRATNTITVRVRDLAKVGPLVAQLTNKGANSLDGVDLAVADPQPILDDLDARATQDARHHAEIYAKAAGVKLGRILRITPLTTAPAPMMRAFKTQMAEAQPAPPVQGGTEQLQARVEVTWELTP